MVLVGLEGLKLNYALSVSCKVSNNAIEYEALLIVFRLSKEMQVKKLVVNSDSQLVVSQVNDNFTTRDKSVSAYLKKVWICSPHLKSLS